MKIAAMQGFMVAATLGTGILCAHLGVMWVAGLNFFTCGLNLANLVNRLINHD